MEILIISGLSGSGKSRAATYLEDIGYYIVDNLPAEMMLKFANFCTASGGRYDRVALVYDVRAGEPFQRLVDVVDKLHRKDGVRCRMLFLEADDPDRDIFLYINSPGGSVSAGLAIYDTMQYIKCEVSTICVGLAASMGAFLLAAGAKGKRRALPNAEIMIHQPSGGARGQATDMNIQVEQILRIKKRLNEILAERTGQPLDKVAADTERDNFMTAEQAKAYGLVDEIIPARR